MPIARRSAAGAACSGMATKTDDEVIFLLQRQDPRHDSVLHRPRQGVCPARYQIPEADRAAKGIFLSNLISLGEGERVTRRLAHQQSRWWLLRKSRVEAMERLMTMKVMTSD